MTQGSGERAETYCVLDADEREYLVGVVGAGPGFDTILEIVAGEEFREFLPPMQLAGLVGLPADDPRRRGALLSGVPVYPDCRALFAAHPAINLVVELRSGVSRRELLDAMPPGASLIDNTASFFLCALSNAVSVGAHCRMRLDHQKLLLEAIVDEVQEDIALLSAAGTVVDLNRNILHRLGQPKELLVGQPCSVLRSGPDDPPFCDPDDPACPFRLALATGKKAERLHTAVSADGRLRYYRTYTYPIADASGKIGHVVVFRRDITDRTVGEISARQAERIETMGRLSSYLAHELRNPMFAASGFARRLANMESLPEAARERAGIVVAELTRMEALLKQFLEFARPVGQAVPGRADADADANRAVLAAVEAVRPEAEAKGIGFALALVPGVAAVAFEPALLKQCVVNLLRNAMDAMIHGGVVRVSSGRDADRVRVRVADSGRGLTHDNLENMFSPFYKADHCEYGLGLAMVKKVVDDFGGAVEAAGEPGGGCAITLHLPPALAGGGADAATAPGGTP